MKTADKWVISLVKSKNVLIYESLYYLIKVSTKYKLKGTIMQILKSANIFVFRRKKHVQDFTLKQLLRTTM